jgi:GR25 family glycosyltransferase involved in LPS biosynthesis
MFFLFLITIIFLTIFLLDFYIGQEPFELVNKYPELDFYVISLDNHSDPISNTKRKLNIKLQEEKLQAPIKIFDAIDGNLIFQQELIEKNILDKNFSLPTSKRNKEIGCYLSHITLYKQILSNKSPLTKYTCIFEDDFNLNQNFYLNQILSQLNFDFDICFLGNTFDNHGNQITKDIYSIDKNKFTIGTYGYLIANSNIEKIIQLTKLIDSPIDNKLDWAYKNNLLNCVVCYPNIVSHQYDYDSSIN